MEWLAETPTRLRVPPELADSEDLRKLCSFKDRAAQFELQRVKDMHWYAGQYGQQAYSELLASAASAVNGTVLRADEAGLWTMPGLASRMISEFGGSLRRAYEMPQPRARRVVGVLKSPRYFQTDAVRELLAVGHGAVELATGLGKSYIITTLARQLGLRTVVVAPTKSIARQLVKDFKELFGSGVVGRFFDSKKEYDSDIVVAVSASLIRVEPGTPAWEALSTCPVLIADESHLLPAETLAKVCQDLLGNAPWRFFLSGTQQRPDGLERVLEGIIGPVVLEMDARQGIAEKFLAPQVFRQWRTQSEDPRRPTDLIKANRIHVLANKKLHAEAAAFAAGAVERGRRVLVMVDEFDQFPILLPHLKHPYRVAHGGVTKDNKDTLPEKHRKSDPEDLVERFDAGEFPVLVGTSCIGIGTDIKSVSAIIDLVGGSAEPRLRQCIGRGTRLFEGKTDCVFMEPVVTNVPQLLKQGEKRAKVFRTISDDVEYLG